jgi:glycosyltransferase involved in cell wall biosynthesis
MGVKKIRVVFFTRKQRGLGNFSVESYFENIRKNLPEKFDSVNIVMPFESNGLFKRFFNALYCITKQGDINHITGDIHYVATFLRKSKTILTILDCGMLHQTKGLKYKILKLFWFTIPIKRAGIITAISTATKQDIIEFTDCVESKIKVVYVCINKMFERRDKVFNTSCPRILQIGTAPNKNLNRLIPALNGVSCKLVIVGKISEEVYILLKENNISYELIDRKISDQEILEQYEKSDIVSFVSTLEGFGMPIVEANAVGRVVIAGDNTSMPEIGENAAYFVDALNILAIKEGIKKIISDADCRQQLIENGFNNKMRFNTENLAIEYANIYDSLVINNNQCGVF